MSDFVQPPPLYAPPGTWTGVAIGPGRGGGYGVELRRRSAGSTQRKSLGVFDTDAEAMAVAQAAGAEHGATIMRFGLPPWRGE